MGEKEIKVILKKYARELNKHIQFKKIILFGSYARGTASKDSDIDTAVIVRNVKGDFLEASALLWRVAADVDFRIEPILIEEKLDKTDFFENILKYGKIIAANN
jgi:predicted nucleotidyltransferase